MRIVAGDARGRQLVRVDGDDVRPTMDRVREAVFNSLYSHGLVEDCTYLDLFAGSGAMGLEALSRGAASCVFVDTNRAAVRAVTANVESLGYLDRATIRQGDAFGAAALAVDVAVLDPPYDFDRWPELLSVVGAAHVVIESDRPVDPGAGWQILRSKRYASTFVVLARRVDTAAADLVHADPEGPHT